MTNTTKKMTKREWYTILTAIVEDSNYADKNGVKAFITHEMDLLNRKSNTSTLTKVQKENRDIKDNIITVLQEENRPMTVSDLMVRLPYNSQKISALLTQLKKCGVVENFKEKKVSYYQLVSKPDEETPTEITK